MMREHRGFWLDVDDEPVHVTGDPHMSQETVAALADLVRAVRKRVSAMNPEEWEEFKRTSVMQSPPGTRVEASDG